MKVKQSMYQAGPIVFTLIALSALATFDAFAKPRTKADNSEINRRDERTNEPTADDQSIEQNASETARKIRAELTSDDKLSTYAKNVKVIVIQHLVTLKGPVTSDAEKIAIVRTASKVAPEYKIENQLQVVR